MNRAQRAASLSCPIDGAATYDSATGTLVHHATLSLAAEHAVRTGARIVAVGNAVNRAGHSIAGLTIAEEQRALEEARATLGAARAVHDGMA